MEVLGAELGPVGFTCLAAGCSIVAGLTAALLGGPAHRIGLVSRSRRDRFGAGHVPLTGGPALLAGILAACLALRYLPRAGHAVAILGFWGIGLLDDFRDLRPRWKFALQALVALVAGALLLPTWTHVGWAFVLLVLLVNASNYLDNMDALLAGVALTQAVALLEFSIDLGPGAPLLLATLPAILFLAIPPARVYLGDSGSHLVGALLGLDVLGLLVDSEGVHPRFVLPLLLVFAVPLADVATVTVSRLRRDRPLFRGGTDHLSHRLVRAGFPVPRAVLVLVLASGVCGVASLLLLHFS
jgi:UDP-GlcNAc:undecaprenyl-phosphate GlcNAc-1-phosphate transferase